MKQKCRVARAFEIVQNDLQDCEPETAGDYMLWRSLFHNDLFFVQLWRHSACYTTTQIGARGRFVLREFRAAKCDACYTWLLCAKPLGVCKDVARLIAKIVRNFYDWDKVYP